MSHSMTDAPKLAPAVAQSLAAWHTMVAAKSTTDLPLISAADVLFRSPAFYKPYQGPQAFQTVIGAVITVFEDFTYHRTLASADGLSVMLEFSARIGDAQLKGIDLIRFNPDGKIAEFEVMIRPMNALMALGKLMSERAGPKLKALAEKQG